jgi:hypothetical protein
VLERRIEIRNRRIELVIGRVSRAAVDEELRVIRIATDCLAEIRDRERPLPSVGED